MKDWFKARNIWGAAIQTLADDEAGRLMKGLWGYTMSGIIPDLEGPEKAIFALILMTLNQDEEKDAEISEKRAAAGAMGGKQKVANAIFATQELANQASASNKNKNKNIDKDIKENITKEKSKRFTPPSREEVAAYCQERNNGIDPQKFIDFYTSKGWMVGKTPMKDWKACVRTWEGRQTTKRVVAQDFQQRDYSGVQDEIISDLAAEIRRFKDSGDG